MLLANWNREIPMHKWLIGFLFTVPVTASALTPIQCSQSSDMLFALLSGQRFPVPEFAQPVLRRAIEHVQANQHQDEPYWHSTMLFMECLRTQGDIDRMYDPRHVIDPSKTSKPA